MKRILLLAIVITATNFSYAQPLSAEELLDMVTCDRYSCIKDKAEQKAYVVAMNKEREGYQVYAFNSKVTYVNGSNADLVSPYKLFYTQRPGDSSIALNYTVGDLEQRDLLIAGFEHVGFKYSHATKTESTNENVATVYTSEKHPDLRLKVTNYRKLFEKKKEYMEYDFEIMRMTKAKPEKKKDNPLQIH